MNPYDLAKELLFSGYQNKKIEAVKIVKERTGLGLKEAKDVVDSVWASYGYGKKRGCYVATCVYGSYDCPQVWTLRRYRDDVLGSTWYGRSFISVYYAISPTLVKCFGNKKWFIKFWRGKLDRMVAKLQEAGIENTPYKDKNWKE